MTDMKRGCREDRFDVTRHFKDRDFASVLQAHAGMLQPEQQIRQNIVAELDFELGRITDRLPNYRNNLAFIVGTGIGPLHLDKNEDRFGLFKKMMGVICADPQLAESFVKGVMHQADLTPLNEGDDMWQFCYQQFSKSALPWLENIEFLQAEDKPKIAVLAVRAQSQIKTLPELTPEVFSI